MSYFGAYDVGARGVGAYDVSAHDVGAPVVGAYGVGTCDTGVHGVGAHGVGAHDVGAHGYKPPSQPSYKKIASLLKSRFGQKICLKVWKAKLEIRQQGNNKKLTELSVNIM